MAIPDTTARAALANCFRAHQALVNGVVLDRCGNSAIAEEITAQTFEAAAIQFARGRGDEVTPGWLTVVAKRRLVDHWRRVAARSRAVHRLAGQTDGAANDPDATVDPAITHALDLLPPTQRTVLTLRYMDDWSVDEIAAGLDISYRAAESQLARARRGFRAALGHPCDQTNGRSGG